MYPLGLPYSAGMRAVRPLRPNRLPGYNINTLPIADGIRLVVVIFLANSQSSYFTVVLVLSCTLPYCPIWPH